MHALILAAGFGSRLMPLTQNVPKCMVEYRGKKIIDYELDSLSEIEKIAIVCGYKANILQEYLKGKISRFYINSNFSSTNMVATLFCAREFLSECAAAKSDIIISYADIIYNREIVDTLIESSGEINIVVDDDWEILWKKRFENPLLDAETLKIRGGKIKEIGKKPHSMSDIESQYIGLFKISHSFIDEMIRFYDSLDKNAKYDGKDFNNMYMTSFLQALINKYNNANAVRINGGWLEIDNVSDLAL